MPRARPWVWGFALKKPPEIIQLSQLSIIFSPWQGHFGLFLSLIFRIATIVVI